MAAFSADCIPQCGCRLERCKICNPAPAPDFSAYIADIKFLMSFVPEWAKEVPRGLDPTFYGTLSYDGDMKVKKRVDELSKKYA